MPVVIPDMPGMVQADPLVPTTKENIKASNTSPTPADDAAVLALSPNNTGLPVNTPVIVQKTNAVSSGSVTTLAKAFTSANAAGNTLIVVASSGSSTAMTVADSAGNTYTSVATSTQSTTLGTAIFYAVNSIAGANTVTLTCTSSSAAMEIYEVSGILQQVQGALGQSSNGTAGSGTTATTSTLAGTGNCLAFLGVGIGTGVNNITITTGTNWTADAGTNGIVTGGTPAGLYQFNSFSQYLPGLKPVLPTATVAGSSAWTAVAAVFKPVVLGIEGTVTIGGYNYTHITAAAPTTTVCKIGSGVLRGIAVNTPIATAVIELDDAITHTNAMGILTIATATAMAPFSLLYDVHFATGLTVYTSTAACDLTVIWR